MYPAITFKEEQVDEYSLIKVITKDLSIPLPPNQLDQVAKTIVKKIQNDWTNRFSIDLQGVLLHHDQLTFKSDYGLIKDDLPQVFWDVSIRAFVFCPTLGSITRGRINKFTKTQVMNAIVHNCVAVFSPEKVHPSIRNQMELGKEILFRIESFNVDHLLIYGIIDEECIQIMAQQKMIQVTALVKRGNSGDGGDDALQIN